MSVHRIVLSELTWTDVEPCLKTVEAATERGTIRLAVFSPGFKDSDWCDHEHLGYCLSGEAEVVFESGEKVVFRTGDVVNIPAGARHKTSVGRKECQIVYFRK